MPHKPAMTASRRTGFFARFSRVVANASGHPAVFAGAVVLIVVWAASGPVFGFSDTWQLVVNTSTTIVTFLMVFLIQSTQNRDTHALQIKLDELIRVTEAAHTALLNLEELSDAELETIRKHYLKLAEQGRESLRTGKADTDAPPLDLQALFDSCRADATKHGR